jgi:hypothetical protein
MKMTLLVCATLGIVLSAATFDVQASVRRGEYRTLQQCLQAIQKNSGERLRVVTDKPANVSGVLSNGQFFGCTRRETGTKGTYFEGYFMVED